jgi:exonuclease III
VSASNQIKLATVNTFFDGVDVNTLSPLQWLYLHFDVFRGSDKLMRKHQEKRSGSHPIEAVIHDKDPDIIVVNEVIVGEPGSKSLEILKDKGYKFRATGCDPNPNGIFERNTLVASRLAGDELSIDIQQFPGGRFCALQFKSMNFVVIGVQGSPFNGMIRKLQIKTVFDYIDRLVSQGMSVIAAGDFNLSLKNSNLTNGNVSYYSERSFPSPKFYEKLKSKGFFQTLMRLGLGLKNGPRRLDHILFSKGVECLKREPFETCSDHKALYAEFQAGQSISDNRESLIL